jgi:AraC-like DNA-binding protein
MPASRDDREAAGPREPDDRAVASIMRAVDFVEERMGEDVGAQEMAAAACYSPFYFSRLFAQATGHSPYDYLMRRRVAAAAEEVVSGSRSLIEIALDRGFDVPDTFARAFRRCFGLAPSEARREESYPRSIARTRIERAYVEAMLACGPPLAEAIEPPPATIEGTWLRGVDAESWRLPAEGGLIIVERDGSLRPSRAFLGSRAPADRGRAAPEFPLAATAIAGGPAARFRVGSPDRLGFVIEYAYKTWLPSTGRTRPPAIDIVEADGVGGLSLLLPLA